MEHSGISNNYAKKLRKICKIKFLKVKTNKNKLVSARKTKTKQKYDKKGKKKEN